MTPRSVVVTGGSRGVGAAVRDRLAADGHRVATLQRTPAAHTGGLDLACDLTDAQQVDRALAQVRAEHGPVEVVVANAGVIDDALLEDLDWERFAALLDVNVGGAFRVIRSAVDDMRAAGWGRIVIVSSISAVWGVAGQTNYNTSKAALVGLGRSLARELGPYGITSNVVLPGYIETDMTAGLPLPRRRRLVAETALGRPGRADEVADAVAWLAGDLAGFVTGASIPVSGGLGMGM